jgi:hypothetical protein
MGGDEEQVRVTDLEPEVGEAKELPPQARVRLKIATYVLGAVGLIVILAMLLMIFCPDNRIDQAKTVFDFVKTIAPPIVTLVLGFYFRNESA